MSSTQVAVNLSQSMNESSAEMERILREILKLLQHVAESVDRYIAAKAARNAK